MLSAEVIREQRDAEAEKNCCSGSFNICFQFALSLFESVMLSIYAKLSSHVLTIRERERERQ